MTTPNLEKLLADWGDRPTTAEWDENDLSKVHKILISLKNAIPEIQAVVRNASNSLLDGRGEVGYPQNEITGPSGDKNTPAVIVDRNQIRTGGWKPRWAREAATTPAPALEDSADATPSNAAPTSPAMAPNNHIQSSNPHTVGIVSASGQTPGTSGTPATAAEKLNVARRTAAMSRTSSSRARAGRKTKVKTSILP